MKGAKWLYLVIYSAFILLVILMSAITDTGTVVSYFQMILLLIPAFVLASELIGKARHMFFSVVGIISLVPILAEAHKFSDFSIVTLAMYVLFLPMLVYLAASLYRSRSENT
ncbi:hypothetical protein [Spongiibacter marinus]|uniref:hypothetical protein n=1 Tax=Spongiibacter marinus TaxID=354246 RepID=UPI003C66C266